MKTSPSDHGCAGGGSMTHLPRAFIQPTWICGQGTKPSPSVAGRILPLWKQNQAFEKGRRCPLSSFNLMPCLLEVSKQSFIQHTDAPHHLLNVHCNSH